MRILKTVMIAGVAFGLMATGAMGQTSNEGEIEVNINVQSFVEVEVIDSVLDWDVGGTSAHDDDMGWHSGEEAKFEVRANDQHNITITSGNGTWNDTANLAAPYDTYEQVKYLNTDGSGSFIGGNLMLIASDAPGSSQNWDGDEGNIVRSGLPADTNIWGIAARGRAVHYGDDENPNGIEGALAPPGTYQTDAVITAAIE